MEEYIPVKGGKLFCRVNGKGTPLLLVHGAGVDADFFKETAEYLAGEYTVITYDRRGHSRSAGDISADYFDQQCEDMQKVMERFCGGEKVIIVGCSAGGTLALHFAQRYPDRVRALILHEPVTARWLRYESEAATATDQIRCALRAGRLRKAMHLFLLYFSDPADTQPRLSEAALEQMEKNLATFMEYEFEHIFYDAPPLLGGRNFPCYVCAGERHELLFYTETAAHIAELYGVPLLSMPGAHNAARDIPQEFAEKCESITQKLTMSNKCGSMAKTK